MARHAQLSRILVKCPESFRSISVATIIIYCKSCHGFLKKMNFALFVKYKYSESYLVL